MERFRGCAAVVPPPWVGWGWGRFLAENVVAGGAEVAEEEEEGSASKYA